jgi:hypothetical protein
MSPPDRKLSIEEQAQKVWDTADDTLKELDGCEIFQKHKCREFPKFLEKEIRSGNKMGQGGFSNVFEILAFYLVEQTQQEESKPSSQQQQRPPLSFKSQSDLEKEDERHYDVSTARSLMERRCMRFGSARYAIKRLRPDLDKLEYARGALDLAIEIKYMSLLWHPNIVKMRAVSETPRLSLDTFIVMGT